MKNAFEVSHATHKTILSMEGIRGFAVFLVFLVHYATLAEPWSRPGTTTRLVSDYIRSIGNIGVDLFFVLSGYLIYGMLIKREKPFGTYLARRIQRIYPAFTAVFVLYLLLSLIFPAQSKIPEGWPGALFVLQNFLLLPGLFDIPAIITVAWSLSYELFYYLLIPLLIAAFNLRVWPPRNRIVLFSSLSVLFFAYFSAHDGPIRLLMFVSGILLFEFSEKRHISRIPAVGLPALALAILSVVALEMLGLNGWWKYALLFVLFFLFCLDCFQSSGMANRLFSLAPLRWLGNMSYSYYLIHGLCLKFLFLCLPFIFPPHQTPFPIFWPLLPVAFLLTLFPAALLFLLIERPYSLVKQKDRAKKRSDLTANTSAPDTEQ